VERAYLSFFSRTPASSIPIHAIEARLVDKALRLVQEHHFVSRTRVETKSITPNTLTGDCPKHAGQLAVKALLDRIEIILRQCSHYRHRM
jgi:hypothetical protein